MDGGSWFSVGGGAFGRDGHPVGPGNIDMQCQFLEDFQSTVLCCTASMGILMAEEIERGPERQNRSQKNDYGL